MQCRQGLSFHKASPSSGLLHACLYVKNQRPQRDRVGAHFSLPLVDKEGWLTEAGLREIFSP